MLLTAPPPRERAAPSRVREVIKRNRALSPEER